MSYTNIHKMSMVENQTRTINTQQFFNPTKEQIAFVYKWPGTELHCRLVMDTVL